MSEGTTGGNFSALLEDLVKSLPSDEGDETKEGGEAADKVEGAEGADAGMAKSFKIKLDDGTEVDAVDGAELIKSLVDRIEGNEGLVLKVVGALTKAITDQGTLIKSLSADIAAFKDAGKGRKAVITIAERPAPKAEDLNKSDAPQMSADEFMAKALSAQVAGRITGLQVSIAEAHLNQQQPPPKDIIQAVLGHSA